MPLDGTERGPFGRFPEYPKYADLDGELVRVRPMQDGGLRAEVRRDDSWMTDPAIGVGEAVFDGHAISRAEAELILSGRRRLRP